MGIPVVLTIVSLLAAAHAALTVARFCALGKSARPIRRGILTTVRVVRSSDDMDATTGCDGAPTNVGIDDSLSTVVDNTDGTDADADGGDNVPIVFIAPSTPCTSATSSYHGR